MTPALYKLYKAIPPGLRHRLKSALRMDGHGRSLFDTLKARKDAASRRRLDHSAEIMFAALRSASMTNLRDKNCMEFGCGYVFSDALGFYLAGAARVSAVDYNPIADFRALRIAFHQADRAKLGAILQDFIEPAAFDARWNNLAAALENSAGARVGLEQLGITYKAPVDYAQTRRCEQIDVIYSRSVLEHLPPPLAPAILQNLCNDLSPTGIMAHIVHLEDHFDFERNPFGYFAEDTDYDPARDYDRRGNRLLLRDWRKICEDLPGISCDFADITRRPHKPRPEKLLPAYASTNPDDLFISLFTLVIRRKASLSTDKLVNKKLP